MLVVKNVYWARAFGVDTPVIVFRKLALVNGRWTRVFDYWSACGFTLAPKRT